MAYSHQPNRDVVIDRHIERMRTSKAIDTPSISVSVVLEYIVTLGNGGGSIFKRHNVFQYNASADARCGQTLRDIPFRQFLGDFS